MQSNTQVIMQDMRTSMTFIDKARPIIAKLLNGGEIMQVEGEDNDVCRMLDRTCGTDYMQVYKNGLVWGVASRIQYGHAYNSFTIRKERESGIKTEYEKRKDAIANHGIYPYLTMQAFADKDTKDIISLAIAKTTDIMDFVDRGLAVERITGTDQIGKARFFVAFWNKMQQAGYKVLVHEAG